MRPEYAPDPLGSYGLNSEVPEVDINSIKGFSVTSDGKY
jgi:hypothetical protein